MNELSANGVQIYSFPIDDETVAEANKVMNVREQLTSNPALKISMLWTLCGTISVICYLILTGTCSFRCGRKQ